MSVKASPTTRTWTVDDDGPADFDNIQEAINNASSGDTIFVHVGTYYEHVVINKTMTLVGEDNNFTIIDGYETDNVIHIRANNVTVKNFTIRESGMYPYSGIFVDHSMGNVIINNKVIYNYEGVSLLYSSSNVVCGNNISNNYHGIYLYSSSNNVFSGNTIFSSNYDGIYLYYSSNNVFSGNTIFSSNYEGIYLYYSSNNVFSGNTIFSSNYDGIYLYSSSNNVVSGNVILHNNFAGMTLYCSSSNVVCGNSVLSNYPGINLALLSSNNTIYHNNFNNKIQARSESTNFWDYDNEGNYWSDYNKQDLNRDGIGDIPYFIDAVNQDNYPLMGMFSNFSITFGGEIYSVTVISNLTVSLFRFEIGAETGNKIIHFNATDGDGTLGFFRVRIPTGLMNYPYIVLVDGEEIIPTVLNVSNEVYAYLYFTYFHKNHTITIISSKTLVLYFELLDEYLKLQKDLYDLNETYYTLLYNYSQLQISLQELNDSYLEHLIDYSEHMQNIRNLTYILVALTAILIVITIYLSKRANANVTTKIKVTEER
jgi:parallel beta-helix repeat protein